MQDIINVPMYNIVNSTIYQYLLTVICSINRDYKKSFTFDSSTLFDSTTLFNMHSLANSFSYY